MKNNHAAREKRRVRYNAGIWTFLSMATATIFGFILWLCGVVVRVGQEVPIP
jgi:nitrate reductase NapE component